jgi:serine/threonine protein kinase
MIIDPIVSGQNARWKLVKKLGEGDAGEVYLVESPIKNRQAILKRPRKGAYSSDIMRQAGQIRAEAQILKALSGVQWPLQGSRLSTPAVLDQSAEQDGAGERFFIVIERAPGVDLRTLSQLARFGQQSAQIDLANSDNQPFIARVIEHGCLPKPLLIRVLAAVLALFDRIHSVNLVDDIGERVGIVWNDVKPEHLYWDAQSGSLTVIDWGNSQFIEADGITRDRLFSYKNDCRQFLQEFGAFLADASPELHARLSWPQDLSGMDVCAEHEQLLRERLAAECDQISDQLRDLHAKETQLSDASRPGLSHLEKFNDLQRQLALYGELANQSQALALHSRIALQLAATRKLSKLEQVCRSTAQLSQAVEEKWYLLGDITHRMLPETGEPDPETVEVFAAALEAGISDDWPSLHWQLNALVSNGVRPDWWDEISRRIRQTHLRLGPEALNPFTAVSRLFYTLQSTVQQADSRSQAPRETGSLSNPDPLQANQKLVRTFQEEVLEKWRQQEPAPPNSGVGYTELNDLLDPIDALLPGTRATLEKILAQPKNQAAIVLNAWERKDFEQARRALRNLLLWDPDRHRLLLAEQAVESATGWLAFVRRGAGKEEPFYDYLTAAALAGRSLRNRVGPAGWLDAILEAFKRLRKGARHADLLIEHPQVLADIPWLNEYQSREVLALPRRRPLSLERDPLNPPSSQPLTGVEDGRLARDLHLAEALDTWAPEALGSSARVFAGILRMRPGKSQACAVKLMRPDRVEYALPLFREEAQILTLLRDVPGITPLLECGYLQLEAGQVLPGEETGESAAGLRGLVLRYGVAETQNFLASLERHLAGGWMPYLVIQRCSQEHNLLTYCDAGHTRGWFLPLRESLLLVIQICDILQSAHERNIVYRDHKLLHYYWDAAAHGVAMIDWNIARRSPQGISEAERQFDLVQFAARALHHILTGRPAPGALPMGPNRPEEIEAASRSYSVNWTYDDERLPNRVKEIIEQALAGGYIQARELRKDLAQVYQQIVEAVQFAS